VLTSCSTFKEYRPFPDGCYQDGSNPKHRGVQLSFIEYDDQGFPWDLNQRLSATAHISATKNLLLVVFVHGWHNDASNYPHKDVETFTTLLNKIGQAAPVRNKYNVYGVFLAWRGERIRGPNETFNQIITPIRSLTFYSCKATASTIADRGFLRDDIYKLTDAARSRTSDSAKPVTIVIGHSFGGLILEEAIANDMAHPRLGSPKKMADLVLMLNPASDSMITAITERAFQESPPPAAQSPLPDGEPRPTMISITSQTDNATGLAFNVGTSISNLFRRTRPVPVGDSLVDEKYLLTHSPGHNDFLKTHEVKPLGSIPSPGGNPFEHNLSTREETRFATQGTNGKWNVWDIRPVKQVARSPYWIVQVPKEIIAGHGDIFNPNALDMLASFFRLNNPIPGMARPPNERQPVLWQGTQPTTRAKVLPAGLVRQKNPPTAPQVVPAEQFQGGRY
jgi:pimeloyl-ACP methyl ester carboxylesterase